MKMAARTKPALSVLIPVYNTAAFLVDAIGSIISQTFSDIEILVVNDGSTDSSEQILKQFSRQEPRLRLISRSNRGLIATRNELLEESRGELIAWMDSDDISKPNRLARQVAALQADPTLVCIGCNARQIDPGGRLLALEAYPTEHAAIVSEQALGGGVRFPTTIVRKTAAQRIGGFREPFRMGEDLDFLIRLAEIGCLGNIPEELYLYRQHLMSTCVAYGSLWPRYRDEIIALAGERRTFGSDRLQRGETIKLPEAEAAAALRQKPHVLAAWSAMAAGQNDWVRALGYATRAIGASPLERSGWRALRRLLF